MPFFRVRPWSFAYVVYEPVPTTDRTVSDTRVDIANGLRGGETLGRSAWTSSCTGVKNTAVSPRGRGYQYYRYYVLAILQWAAWASMLISHNIPDRRRKPQKPKETYCMYCLVLFCYVVKMFRAVKSCCVSFVVYTMRMRANDRGGTYYWSI